MRAPPFSVAPADDRRTRFERGSLYDRVLFGRQTLLVAVALLCIVLRHRLEHPLTVSLVLVVAGAINVLHDVLHGRGRFPRALPITQLWADVAAVSFLVAVTGGSGSPFVALFLAVILASAAPLSPAAPWWAMGTCALGYAVALRVAGDAVSSVSAAHLVLLVGAGAVAFGHVRRVRALLRFRAAATAHEIKNSAHTARLLLDEARAQATPDAMPLLDAAATELQGLSAMAQRLYGLSAPSAVRAFALATVLDEALILAGPSLRAACIAVEREGAPRAVWLRADADAVRHGMLNLLLNAAEHGGAGGQVRVRTLCTWREARIEFDSLAARDGDDRPVSEAPVTTCGGWGIGGRVVRELLAPAGARLELARIEGGLRATIVMPALAWPTRTHRPVIVGAAEPALATRIAP